LKITKWLSNPQIYEGHTTRWLNEKGQTTIYKT